MNWDVAGAIVTRSVLFVSETVDAMLRREMAVSRLQGATD